MSIRWPASLVQAIAERVEHAENPARHRGLEAVAKVPSCRRAPSALQRGCSESLDPENVGDIADEGAGHRG